VADCVNGLACAVGYVSGALVYIVAKLVQLVFGMTVTTEDRQILCIRLGMDPPVRRETSPRCGFLQNTYIHAFYGSGA